MRVEASITAFWQTAPTPTSSTTVNATSTTTPTLSIEEIVIATVDALRIQEEANLSPAEAASLTSLALQQSQDGNRFTTLVLGGLFTLALISILGIGILLVTIRYQPMWLGKTDSFSSLKNTQNNATTNSMYEIFVSSSGEDKDWVSQLVLDLDYLQFKVWWYVNDALGQRFGPAINQAIKDCKIFMVIISPSSMLSNNVEDEIRLAVKLEKPIVSVMCRETKIENFHYGLWGISYFDFTDTAEADKYKECMRKLEEKLFEHLGNLMTDSETETVSGHLIE